MVNGTGVDLWWDSITSLSEERYYKDGAIHGLVRMWNPDQRSVWEEEHWWNDSQHGISRRWEGTKDSRLAQGYPEFYVNGKQVGKVDYMCLSQEDPTLPSYREKDNSPFRTLPRMAKQQRLKYGKQ